MTKRGSNDSESATVRSIVDHVTFASYHNDPEIVIAIVGPVGVDMDLVTSTIKHELGTFDYKSVSIRVSDLAQGFNLGVEIQNTSLDEHISSKMKIGNRLRQKTKENSAFAFLACVAIRKQREQLTGNPYLPSQRTAYILHQFKRPEETQALRRIYGRHFIQISVHSNERTRLQSLADRISHSLHGAESPRQAQERALRLMIRDEDERDDAHGQRLRDTFHLADVIVDASSKPALERNLSRALDGFFGHPFISPSPDEYYMSIAKEVARRSTDLSRQVGAAIMRSSGEVASLGCNEVPKAGGGTYWEGDDNDARDFVLGYDPNVREKDRIMRDIVRRVFNTFTESKVYDNYINPKNINFIDEFISCNMRDLKDALLMDLLEFGRVVHAEMNAVTDAARLGISLSGSTLYSTTFPCHMCARHIVAAGISNVVYLEPYVKSLAGQLYSDSIALESSNDLLEKVQFKPFVGIAPPLYNRVFERDGKRKDAQGNAKKWQRKNAQPIVNQISPSYLFNELRITKIFTDLLEKKGLLVSGPKRIE